VALEIHRQAHGLPRMVNRLAHGCLVAAACERKDMVDLPCLDQAASELLGALN
jgi:type II secretory pathway predicted ATPase ExeA